MNAAHFHLAINHLPVLGLFFGLGVLIIGRFIHSGVTQRVGFWLCVAAGGFSVPAYLTGEPAEEIIEKMPDISKALIEQHEEAASIALAATLLVGALALGALFFARGARPISTLSFSIVTAIALVAFGAMAWTAKLGGEISHPEIRAGQAPAALHDD